MAGWIATLDGQHNLNPEETERRPSQESMEQLKLVVETLAEGWVRKSNQCAEQHGKEPRDGQAGE